MLLVTHHPRLAEYHQRWLKCEGVRLVKAEGEDYYRLEIADNLADEVRRELEAQFGKAA